MELIVSLLGIPLLVLLVTGPFAASIFIALLRRNSSRWLWSFSLGLGLLTILLGIFIAHTFANFFPGIGCFITLLTPIVALVTFLSFRFRARKVQASFAADAPQRHWFLIGSLMIPLLQIAAPVVSFGYGVACQGLDQQAAKPIIAALHKYQAETGTFPVLVSPSESDLSMLVPRYLASIPQPSCNVPILEADPYTPGETRWSLYSCNNSPGHETLLMVPIIGSDSRQLYNLNTGHWSTGNSFDGYCSYLR